MSRAILLCALATAAACGDNIRTGSPPTIDDLAVTTAEDTPLVRIIDVTPDGVSLSASQPAHGTISFVANTFTYTPALDYHGPDSFTVTASSGTEEATATVSITVTPVNDAPAAVADTFATNEDNAHDTPVSALLANDGDVDGDTITLTDVGNATNGTVMRVGDDIIFTPTPNFVGTGSYRYAITDGMLTDDATVTITVGGINDAPVAVDDTRSTPEDTDLVVTGASLVANDTDAENQTLTVTAVGTPSQGTAMLASGNVTYVPPANFSGTVTFDYTVSDGANTDTGTVTVTVTPVNDAPVATDDNAATSQDTPVVIPTSALLANDTDVDSTLTVASVGNPVNGTVMLSNNSITFTPASGFVGNATFEYVVTDGTLTDTGLVTVAVAACTPVDDNIACTVDACQNGQPVNVPNHMACEVDGFACTVPTCSTTTGCSETPTNAVCNDNATCTTEVCAPGAGANSAGCVVTPDNSACSDTLTCTADSCAPGTAGANATTATFSFADGGDMIVIAAQDNDTLDVVDFTVLVVGSERRALGDGVPRVCGTHDAAARSADRRERDGECERQRRRVVHHVPRREYGRRGEPAL